MAAALFRAVLGRAVASVALVEKVDDHTDVLRLRLHPITNDDGDGGGDDDDDDDHSGNGAALFAGGGPGAAAQQSVMPRVACPRVFIKRTTDFHLARLSVWYLLVFAFAF
jgi:hypothetical protein